VRNPEPAFRGAGGEPQRGADLLAGVVDQLRAGEVQRPPVEGGEDLLLGGVQQRDVPFERK
jgi:hypothetical protein